MAIEIEGIGNPIKESKLESVASAGLRYAFDVVQTAMFCLASPLIFATVCFENAKKRQQQKLIELRK